MTRESLKLCTVCASNQNRSMQAHYMLKKHGFDVKSYGTGSLVKLPGVSYNKPVIYQFGKPYQEMYEELSQKDPRHYKANGVLSMLDRNRKIKDHPEKWHENRNIFDVIITCEMRCFEAVCADLMNRGSRLNRVVHVINVDIKDTHEQALVGGDGILDLAEMLAKSSDIDSDIMEILGTWQDAHPTLPVAHCIAYF